MHRRLAPPPHEEVNDLDRIDEIWRHGGWAAYDRGVGGRLQRALIIATASALCALGCDGDGGASSNDAPPQIGDAAPVADVGPVAVPIHLRITSGLPTGYPRVRLRLLIEGQDVEHRRVVTIPPYEGWPLELVADPVPPGRYRLVVFQDRDADESFDACPYPPDPGHVADADTFDNVYGVYEGPVGVDVVTVRVERHICGPGEPATGLRGRVLPPTDVDLAGVPVHLMLTPHTQGGGAESDLRDAQNLPLLPGGLSGPVDFELGELVPGVYTLLLYADGDRNGAPTLCGPGVGGGDGYLATVSEFEIVAGERRPLDAPLQLTRPEGCPEVLTGLRGELRLDVALVAALAEDPTLADSLGLLGGALRLGLFDADGMAVESIELSGGLGAKPHAFTATGLPPGEWRLAVWLDRDEDGQLGPCGGLPAGLDTVYVQRDVEVREGQIVDLEEIVLAEGECEPGIVSGVRGTVSVPVEADSVGSGRPVRLELYPVADGAERRSLLLFENHRALPTAEVHFVAIDVPPGLYQGRIYLDTDRDGDFTSCLDAPFADRATTEAFEVEVGPDSIVDLGPQAPTLLGCEVPTTTVEIAVRGEGVDVASAAWPLRVSVEEAGGWTEDRPLQRLLDPALAPQVISLAPGAYRLVAYLDAGDDERYTPCGDAAGVPDVFAAVVAVVLDEASREVRPEFSLERLCD